LAHQAVASDNSPPDRQLYGALEAGLGYNSNPASSPGDPEFAGFQLDDLAVGSESSVLTLSATATYRSQERLAVGPDAEVSANCRRFPSTREIDECRAFATAGYRMRIAPQSHAYVALSGSRTVIDGRGNRFSGSVRLQLRHELSSRWAALLEGAASRIGYDESRLSVLEVDRAIASIGVSGSGLFGGKLSVGAFVLGGGDEPVDASSTFGNHRYGGRLAAEVRLPKSYLLFGDVGSIHSDFDGEFGFFFRDRVEDSHTASVGIRRRVARRWTITTVARYTKVDSTIDLFTFERTEFMVGLKRDAAL
jgi:hypothetical protein